MPMRGILNFFRRFWWVLVLASIVASAFIIYFTWPEAPVTEIEAARKALNDAKRSQSQTFAKGQHDEAHRCYNLAMKHWKEENDKIWFRRNYSMVALMANKARLAAIAASRSSSKNKSQISSRLSDSLKQLEDDCNYFDATFKHVPLKASLPKLAVKSKLLLSEAQLAMERGDINMASSKADEGLGYIRKVLKDGSEEIKDYFNDFRRWESDFKKVVASSKASGDYAIVVDKFAFKCFLYKSGRQVAVYDAEFGKNWIGSKQYQGDKATPEGIYSIIKKKGRGNTIYHLALLLNYPNEEDYKRFAAAKKAGRIGKRTSIGGLIEIHGHGGQGANWTEGCIALSDDDMSSLFSKVSTGTTVLIVGSLRSFDEVFKRDI
jgi:hypothetical protein